MKTYVKGFYAGQPFEGVLYNKDGFGYHVTVDWLKDPVFCPKNKWRLAQIVVPPYAGNGYDIEFVRKERKENI